MEELTQTFKTIENDYTLDVQSQKLNLLVHQHLATNRHPMSIIVVFAIAAIIMMFPNVLLNRFDKSFVIFNIYSKNRSQSFLRLNDRIKWAVCVALFIGTIGGLIAAHIDRLF